MAFSNTRTRQIWFRALQILREPSNSFNQRAMQSFTSQDARMRRPALAARPGRLDAILGLPPQSQQPLESQRHSVQVAARSRDRLPDLPPDSEPSAYCLNSQAYGADTQRSFVSSCSQGPQ
eukprot:19172-Heterococcus_DN1.PRE.1